MIQVLHHRFFKGKTPVALGFSGIGDLNRHPAFPAPIGGISERICESMMNPQQKVMIDERDGIYHRGQFRFWKSLC